MKLTRISFDSPPLAFQAQEGRVQRVSLALWDETEPEGQRKPVLVASPVTRARTFVVVWPTDADGYLDADRIKRGEVEVLPWDLSAEDLAQLQALAKHWALDRHDLLIRPHVFDPCPRTLRTMDLGIGLKQRIDAAVAREAA